VVGTARCAVRAAYSGATSARNSDVLTQSFRPLSAGGDIAARCPYLPPCAKWVRADSAVRAPEAG